MNDPRSNATDAGHPDTGGLRSPGDGIRAADPRSAVSHRDFDVLLRELTSPADIRPDRLLTIWGMCRDRPDCPAEVRVPLGHRFLRQGESILAYDVLAGVLAEAEGDGGALRPELRIRARQLLALALAQSGASERARDMLLALRAEGTETPETLGLLGRTCKDLMVQAATAGERARWMEESFACYFAGFTMATAASRGAPPAGHGGDVYYCGINAAALAVLRNRPGEARQLARHVREVCRGMAERGGADGQEDGYWLAATLAEAELIDGHVAAAAAAYREAAGRAGNNWRELSSTRRQARLLERPLGLAPGSVDAFFPPMSVAVFASPETAGPARYAGAPEWERRQAAAFRTTFDAEGVICAYSTASSPADIVFIETLLDAGREVHVILPCPREVARGAFREAPGWAARFDRLLSRAPSVLEDVQPSVLNPSVNRAFASLRALGAGLLRARQLDARLHLWTADAALRRRVKALAWATVHPVAHEPGRNAAAGKAPPTGVSSSGGIGDPLPRFLSCEPPAPGRPPSESHAIRAMLFGDVRGYSRLSDAQLLQFARHVMARVASVLEERPSGILSRRTAGDGLFLVLDNADAAADVAFRLRDAFVETRWDAFGLPERLEMRISLDAGPVYAFRDPVTHGDDVCGACVNRAARIEPITPPNHVYASEAFAALHEATCRTPLRLDYVGRTPLPKGFGLAPLYCCRRIAGNAP